MKAIYFIHRHVWAWLICCALLTAGNAAAESGRVGVEIGRDDVTVKIYNEWQDYFSEQKQPTPKPLVELIQVTPRTGVNPFNSIEPINNRDGEILPSDIPPPVAGQPVCIPADALYDAGFIASIELNPAGECSVKTGMTPPGGYNQDLVIQVAGVYMTSAGNPPVLLGTYMIVLLSGGTWEAVPSIPVPYEVGPGITELTVRNIASQATFRLFIDITETGISIVSITRV
jgi:hypothetical protein